MSLKSRGIAGERELVHLLHSVGYAAIRIAGSGSTKAPSTDILAGNGTRYLSLECKTIRTGYRYIPKKEMREFVQFSRQFGAEPWISVRFMRKEWVFLLPEDLVETTENYGITRKIVEDKGIAFSVFFAMTQRASQDNPDLGTSE